MSQNDDRPGAITRRGMLSGVGAALLGTSLVVTDQASAAVPPAATGVAQPSGDASGFTSPVANTLASAPTSGYVYRFVSLYDFSPFYPTSQVTWGGLGVYTAGTGGPLRASIEIPAGALVREIEYYISNTSGSNVYPDTYIYVPGLGAISSIGASSAVASTTSTIVTATKVAVTEQGPYPLGSRLLLSLTTPTSGAVQVNGGRAAFTGGAATVGLHSAPTRVYDSQQSGGKLGANEVRVITLPASQFAPGMIGMIANITVLGSAGDGDLKVFRADVGQPTQVSMRYGKSTATDQIMVEVSANRQIKVRASRSVHIYIDLIGTLS